MNQTISTAAGAMLAPKVIRAFRFRWLVYGAVAYFGLRLMKQNGIFEKQADAALGRH